MLTRLVAKMLVFDEEGKLLALRRSADDLHRPDGFDLPGGRVEGDEQIFEAAIRETAEEAGLWFKPSDLQLVFASAKAVDHDEEHAVINLVCFGFIAKLPKEQAVQLSHEHSAFEWLTLDNAIEACDSVTQKAFMRHVRDNGLAEHSTIG